MDEPPAHVGDADAGNAREAIRAGVTRCLVPPFRRETPALRPVAARAAAAGQP